ncbi:heavy-metal-associated domain-containing protein [Spiractinospora alimapuensis]|uniref:heavy-metal-associated domain-containing protein n=1 Tax=Spiractinospora alimapuensis TaxID=2820884 RepID=UPI001F2848E7|nr:heavy-metal-associated domain-containing protein [Spiractinospora alimapuensis]QVQ50429.1 heavy-metal-associated domain-containing protein [Spiractinospora alimapuensis]
MNEAAATTASYAVEGMTCGHCVSAVTEEVGAVRGVTEVDVDLATGRLRVTGDGTFDDAAISAAVDEAGYTVTGRV